MALTRKNALFAGSDAGGETLADAMTLIETAKLSGLNPQAYLTAGQRGRAAPTGRLRRTWFETIEEMQVALDGYLKSYNESRPHQGRGMKGRTPLQAFKAGIKLPGAKKEEPTTEKPTDIQTAAA